jgi:hypothetical protein
LSSRQILVLTTTDTPFGDSSEDLELRKVVIQRADDAKEENIEINVLPLCQKDQAFDVSRFYSEIISAPAPTPLVLGGESDPKTDDVHLAQFKSKVCIRHVPSVSLSIYQYQASHRTKTVRVIISRHGLCSPLAVQRALCSHL